LAANDHSGLYTANPRFVIHAKRFGELWPTDDHDIFFVGYNISGKRGLG
jgi:hypothetical protein